MARSRAIDEGGRVRPLSFVSGPRFCLRPCAVRGSIGRRAFPRIACRFRMRAAPEGCSTVFLPGAARSGPFRPAAADISNAAFCLASRRPFVPETWLGLCLLRARGCERARAVLAAVVWQVVPRVSANGLEVSRTPPPAGLPMVLPALPRCACGGRAASGIPRRKAARSLGGPSGRFAGGSYGLATVLAAARPVPPGWSRPRGFPPLRNGPSGLAAVAPGTMSNPSRLVMPLRLPAGVTEK